MLPQQPDDDGGSEGAAAAAFGTSGGAAAGRNAAADNVSDNGSFHASAWEEERLKRSHVRWAGEQQQQGQNSILFKNISTVIKNPAIATTKSNRHQEFFNVFF